MGKYTHEPFLCYRHSKMWRLYFSRGTMPKTPIQEVCVLINFSLKWMFRTSFHMERCTLLQSRSGFNLEHVVGLTRHQTIYISLSWWRKYVKLAINFRLPCVLDQLAGNWGFLITIASILRFKIFMFIFREEQFIYSTLLVRRKLPGKTQYRMRTTKTTQGIAEF